MKKAVSLIIGLWVLLVPMFFTTATSVEAQQIGRCPQVSFNPDPPSPQGFTISFTLDPQIVQPGNTYEIRRRNEDSPTGGWDTSVYLGGNYAQLNGNVLSRTFDGNFNAADRFQFMVRINDNDYCNTFMEPLMQPTCTPDIISIPSDTVVGAGTRITVNRQAITGFSAGDYWVNMNDTALCSFAVGGIGCRGETYPYTFFRESNTLSVEGRDGTVYCAFNVSIPTTPGGKITISEIDPENVTLETLPYELCKQIPDPAKKSSCESCYNQNPRGIWTAVGCIPATSSGIVRQLLTIGLSLAGGAAILLVLASGFLFTTSQGDPKRTGEAREMLTSAVIGLLFIIFSVTILQFIGVTLFRLPGFGG